jgi:hypothetical protein
MSPNIIFSVVAIQSAGDMAKATTAALLRVFPDILKSFFKRKH